MNLPDLKKLSKVIDLCRKKGVQSIEIDNVKITLSDTLPEKPAKKSAPSSVTPEEAAFESDGPTGDALLFWSAGHALPEETAKE